MRRLWKSFIPLLLALALLSGCAAQPGTAGTRAVTDSAGRTVALPAEVGRIACVCPFTGPILVMLGCGEKITTACNNMTRSVLLNELCPGMAAVPAAKSGGSVNAETVLQYGADVLFVDAATYAAAEQREKLDALGIPYVVIACDTLERQLEAVGVIGAAVGQTARAEAYVRWCRETMDAVARTCAAIPAARRARLYHAVNEAVRTDAAGSVCAEWIALTGAENVSLAESDALRRDGEKTYTTLEQIYVWDPDLIICNEIGVDDYILGDEKWAGLRCVQAGRVYQIPVGIARMGHPTSTETPLALLWLAELLYPDDFEIDMPRELKDYYRTFYGYELSDALAAAILNGDDMRTAKTAGRQE